MKLSLILLNSAWPAGAGYLLVYFYLVAGFLALRIPVGLVLLIMRFAKGSPQVAQTRWMKRLTPVRIGGLVLFLVGAPLSAALDPGFGYYATLQADIADGAFYAAAAGIILGGLADVTCAVLRCILLARYRP